MLFSFVNNGLCELVARNPGKIVGPIATFLGVIYNALFNFIYAFVQSGSLGIAIILFTLIVKLILTPLIVKQQHSSYMMQKIQPEINKINEKYAKKKDTESQQRKALELQELQKKNGISLMGGCLPLLVQLPILYALFYIFQQAYMYVDVVNQNYTDISNVLLQIEPQLRVDLLAPIADPIAKAAKQTWDLGIVGDLVKVVNEMSNAQWDMVLSQIGSLSDQLAPLLERKNEIEYFLGIHLIYKPGFGFPEILIPLAAGFSTYLSSWMITKNQKMNPDDPTAGTMKMMNTFMPIMMGVMTISMPAGLGLYWTISNIFQMGQQFLLQRYFQARDARLEKGAA